jgi:hypothetical protein
MAEQTTNAGGGLVQEALELRHAVEAMAEQCQRLYERTNDLVERTRRFEPGAGVIPGTDTPSMSAANVGGVVRAVLPR